MREIEEVEAKGKWKFKPDPKGFFLIGIDRERGLIRVEHYENVVKEGRIVSGKIDRVIVGRKAEDIYKTVIDLNLISTFEHAAYLGYELCKAEYALQTGSKYVQDINLEINLIRPKKA